MGLTDLTSRLRLDISQFTSALNTARRTTQRFASQLASANSSASAEALITNYRSLNDRLRTVGASFRDISRIVSGIMISQAFYGITNAISDATSALWEFNKELDYAQITYSSLFSSTSIATDFLETLKQYSVDTIFEYNELENMSRKLLAYGIEYKNLMYIIEGLTNIGTLSGDAAALERLAVAIGQVNAKGVLKAEEVRQLTNAYAPMYDILREKFNLSDEDFKSIGDLGISAADTIDAIVEYANERFGDVANSAMYTVKGINNKVIDSLKVMGADMLAPFTNFYKSLASYIAEQLQTIQGIYESSGIGGVFEYLVPNEEWQARLRNLFAAIKNFASTVVVAFQTLGPPILQILGGLIDAFTIVLGVINSASGATLGFMQTLSSTTPVVQVLTKALLIAGAAWAFFKLQALAAAIVSGVKVAIIGVAKAVVALTTALMSHPIVATIMLLGAVLLGVSANANNANNAISKLMNTLNSYSAGGSTADDMLQVGEAMDEAATNSDQFWNSMEDSANAAEGAADAAGDASKKAADKAKKAASGLLGFDEVFKLPQPSDSADAGAGGLGGLGDLSGLGDLTGALSGLGDSLIPEIPDLSTFAKDFVGTLYDELWGALKTIGSGAATGALIGGLIGFAIGGFITKSMSGALAGAKLGAKIGAVAGGAFAGFWTDTYKQLEDSLIRIAVGTGAGALVGGLVGMVIGAFATKNLKGAIEGAKIGASIGSFLGAGVGSFWSAASAEMSNAIEGIVVGGGAGALAGALAGFVIGAFATRTLNGALSGAKLGTTVGAALGSTIGGIFSSGESAIANAIKRIAVGGAEGALIGGLAGMVIGAFATKSLSGALTGAKWGAAIGGMIGGATEGIFGEAEKTIGDHLENMFASVQAASVGSMIGALAGLIIGAVIGAFAGGVGALPGAQAGATIGAVAGGLIGMLVDYLSSIDFGSAIADWFSGIGASIGDWISNAFSAITNWASNVGSTISNWASNTKEKITNWASNTKEKITTWVSNTKEKIADWQANNREKITTWVSDTKEKVSNWASDTKEKITTWASNTKEKIADWQANNREKITNWVSDTKEKVANWASNTKEKITTWASNTKEKFSDWQANNREKITNWATDTKGKINSWTTDTKGKITNWATSFKTTVTDWYDRTKTKVTGWFNDTGTKISGWFTEKKEAVKTGWNNLWDTSKWSAGWDKVKQWFTNLFNKISGWFTGLKDKVKSWWDGLFSDKSASVTVDGKTSTVKASVNAGHAKGGIFNREHIARFAEGNKAEAVIPLEDNTAMRPFVNMVSDGILQSLLPAVSGGVNNSRSSDLPPMYVGTLIADERGIQQLYKKFQIIEAKELARKGGYA